MSRACLLCASTSSTLLELGEPEERVGRNVICSGCGLIFHDPPPSQAELHRLYAEDYAGEYTASQEVSRALAQERVRCLTGHIPPESLGPVLEVGCANGEFLQQLSQIGIECKGVEPSLAMSRRGREELGVDVLTGIYADLEELDGAYGAICMFHVLEHLVDPRSALQRARRELRPNGLLFLEVPTLADCQLAMVFKAIHPFTFVAETLVALLQAVGFAPSVVQQRGYHLRVLARPAQRQEAEYPDASAVSHRVDEYLHRRREVVDRLVGILEELVGEPELALYGAGLNTLDLNEVFDLGRLSITGLYDADPRKQGTELLGLRVESPRALESFAGSCVIVSSYAFQEEICEQLSHLRERGVRLVTLYEKTEA